MTQDELFRQHLPESLYLNHYQLQDMFPTHTADDWRRYLAENQQFIMRELSYITEAQARSSLTKLSSGKLTSPDIAAIRALIDKSAQINQSSQSRETFVTLFMPNTENLQPEKNIAQILTEQRTAHDKIIDRFFRDHNLPRLRTRIGRQDVLQNLNGTLVFPEPMTEHEHLYVDIFNPENRYITEEELTQ